MLNGMLNFIFLRFPLERRRNILLYPSCTQTSESSSKPIEEPISDSTPTPSKPSSKSKPHLQPSPSLTPESGEATHLESGAKKKKEKNKQTCLYSLGTLY